MSDITLHTQHLVKQIRADILNSSTIYILSSFIMRSGVNVIFNELQSALDQGADVKVLTGDYLFITQPEALKRLLALEGEQLEIRLWQSSGISFHPKSFIFKHGEKGAFIIGSSNLSRSALTSGIEWNVRLPRAASELTFDEAMHHYIALFYSEQTVIINAESIKRYEADYDAFHVQHPDLMVTWSEREEIELTLPAVEDQEAEQWQIEDQTDAYESGAEIVPRDAQIIALEALEETLAEDYTKALVVMATGLGKTYLAAFFAKRFKKVLFIAHREELIKQAKASFEKVLHKTGGLFYGLEKDTDHDLLFASIFSLSIQDHLHQFDRDEFDLIIIDEFHRAAAQTYDRVINYFEPDFLLGLTATPERTDGQDVFALCDGNVAYEITFIEAIKRTWLTPFTYYGIKDDINYEQIRWVGQGYDAAALALEQLQTERAAYIFSQWQKYKQTRTLGFCSSIAQADYLAAYFNAQGVQALSLTSTTRSISRTEAIAKLERREIDIIFTVDLFNEGVDIPSVDTLLFTRPTESLVVFTQQIGRGLRKLPGKETCVIIDLIGNYRHADTKMQVFQDASAGERRPQDVVPIVPASCAMHLDTEVIDLLKALRKKRSPRRERVWLDYLEVKTSLGRRPTYTEAHLHGTTDSKEYRQAFGGYFSFLYEHDQLTTHEEAVYEQHYEWLLKVEKELMTKSYKMVVLAYLLEKGPDRWRETVTPEEVAPYFHAYYMAKGYRKRIDFSSRNTKALWEYDEAKVARLIRTMPMAKWVSKDDLVTFEDDRFTINFSVADEHAVILHQMTQEIAMYKLHVYFERKGYQGK